MWTTTATTTTITKIQRLLTTNLPMSVVQNGNMILVDTGRAKGQESMFKKLNKICSNEEFKLIILTHTHPDHIETLASIAKKWDVKVLVHSSEAQNIVAHIDHERIIEFEDSFDLNDIGINGVVIHTPGHSPGSSSVILNNEIALVGDHIGDFFTKPWAKNNKKVSNSSLKSMERLLNLGCKLYIPAHKKNWFEYDQLNAVYQRYVNGEAVYEKQI